MTRLPSPPLPAAQPTTVSPIARVAKSESVTATERTRRVTCVKIAGGLVISNGLPNSRGSICPLPCEFQFLSVDPLILLQRFFLGSVKTIGGWIPTYGKGVHPKPSHLRSHSARANSVPSRDSVRKEVITSPIPSRSKVKVLGELTMSAGNENTMSCLL